MRMHNWLLALLAASTLLCGAGAAFAAQGSSCTYLPNGLSLSTIDDSSTNTVDGDDLYVKGLVEIDGNVYLGDSSGDTITIAGTPTFSAAVSFNGNVTLGDASGDSVTITADTVSLTHASVITCETIKAVDSEGLMLYGYAGDADLLQVYDASTERFAITTATDADSITLTFTDKDGAATIVYDHGAVAEFTCNHGFEALEINTATIGDATDGTNAMTIADTGVVTFAQTPVGTDLDFSGTLYADKVYSDQLEDEAGTGAPTAAHGLKTDTITANSAAGVTVVGYAADADLLQVADASTERFAITTAASADSITLTFTDKDGAATLIYDHGATAEFNFNHAVEATEFNAATVGAADGTDAITIADSTGGLTIPGASTSFSNVACAVNLGTANSTTGSQLSIFDGGSDNKPGAVCLYQDDGGATWLFARSDGTLATHTAYPTDDDADGTAIGTFNMAADVDLTSADGTNADPDLGVAGVAKFSKGGLILTAASSPPLASSTPEGCLWVTNGTPDGGKTAYKLYVFINSSWAAVH